MVATLPETGQLVDVRGARWIVTDVAAQGLPRSSADDGTTDIQHAVALQAIGDDRYGDELRVVWEIEAGTNLVPEQGLPSIIAVDRMDDPSTLAAFVDALRWGAVTSADPTAYQAPFRSGASLEPYQLEPLRRALASPRTNLLLADDVGLGKTIEAGLVIQELLLRHRARSVIVVCPAGLVLKWKDEMAEKFGLPFEVVSSETMRDVRRRYGVNANPFDLFPRVIVSMSWLPTPRAQRLLQGAFDVAKQRIGSGGFVFDVLVVDEAHHVAPSAPPRTTEKRAYAVDSLRTIAVRELAHRCEHRLFLSATPHNGHQESFTALLEMIDDHRFARGADIDRAALAEVAVRRLKSDLADDRFHDREVRPLSYSPTTEEEEAYDRLVGLLVRRQKAAKAEGGSAADIAALLLKKRFLSSPWAFARTATVYLEARRHGRAADLPDYDDVLGEEATDEEEGRTEQPELDALVEARRTLPDLPKQDIEDLEWLIDWGSTYEAAADAKLSRLLDLLDGIVRTNGTWLNERFVIFTEYVDTLEWIQRVLTAAGYGSDRLAVIHGQTPPEERADIRRRFTADPAEHPIRILLATDAAGEGIDLQRYCHRLVNFDVPFNPNRLEQRIGRIDRYGQPETPIVWHFVADAEDGSALGHDVDLLRRLASKLQQIRSDLGSANEILAPDMERELLGRSPRAHRTRRDASDRAITEMLGGERTLSAELTRIADDLAGVRARLHLHPRNMRRVVDTALTLQGQPTLVEVGGEQDAPELDVPTSVGRSWQLATADLVDPLSGVRRPVCFDGEATKGRTDVVHAHLGHPLVQLATRSLRAELWRPDPAIHRVTAVVVPDLRDSFVAAVARLVLVGASGIRLHEEVFLAGTRLHRRQDLGEDFAEGLLADALDGEGLQPAPPNVLGPVIERWNEEADHENGLRRRVERAVRERAGRRLREVAADLEKRCTADLDRVDVTFQRFEDTLARSLAHMKEDAAATEGMLPGSDAGAAQRRRDIRAVETRFDVLAEERQRERAGVRSRYHEPVPHTFSGALIFALAPGDAAETLS